ncbi:MAG: carboxypeptidase regulatory-like domain-containing protein [Candidatus Electrothrix sp. MAN1_4]|nr:carboxypeptidase regulatory-like domain-containing protein [Candidatus Electrothrix sp. MAN1_4]
MRHLVKKITLLFIVSILSYSLFFSTTAVSNTLVLPWKSGNFLVIHAKNGIDSSPIVTISATPETIASGSAAVLTWQTEHADNVSIDNDVGDVAPNGSLSVNPTETTTYTITAKGSGGTTTGTATVKFSDVQPPSVLLDAHPTSINTGESSLLIWTCTNADSITIDNDIGTVNLNGAISFSGFVYVQPTVTTTYTITAEGPGGITTESITIHVAGTTPTPTVAITADPLSIVAGDTSTLSWTSTNVGSVSIDNDIGMVDFNGSVSVTPTETTAYTITATGAGGIVSKSVTVTVLPLPAVTIAAEPAAIPKGDSSVLSWTSINADSVSINNGIGTVDLNGSVSVSPSVTTTYTITATGAGGTVSESTTVTVHPLPTVSLSADPTSIPAGTSSQLVWSSTNAHSVNITPDVGSISVNGTATVSPSETTTYMITATGPGGTVTDTVTVEVVPAGPTITIAAAPEIISLGASTELSWQSSKVETVSIDNGIGPVAANDALSVTPEHTTTYTISGSGAEGTVSAQVTVQVQGNPESQPEGSFGKKYNDLIPKDATVDEYDPKRFTLITGAVTDMAGSPLADVHITIHGHPEYGTVLTDTEGTFTIPVEGGGTMTLAYKHDGFITSHRQVSVPWNDIAIAETVQMLTEDPVTTTVAFDGNPETVVTHTSSQVSDDFGSRSTSVVFQGDNKAYLVDEQGNTVQELSNITTRATEFKTQKSMPAALPPHSARLHPRAGHKASCNPRA